MKCPYCRFDFSARQVVCPDCQVPLVEAPDGADESEGSRAGCEWREPSLDLTLIPVEEWRDQPSGALQKSLIDKILEDARKGAAEKTYGDLESEAPTVQ